MAPFPLSAETIRLTNGEWPPYTSQNLKPHFGIVSHLVTKAFALMGITVQYGFFPLKREIEYAKNEGWDGSIGWALGRRELTKDFFFSKPIITIPKALYSLRTKPVIWNTMKDLKGKHIGITAGYFYGEAFERAKQERLFIVEEVTYDAQNLKKLLLGRIDAFAMEVETAIYLMNHLIIPEEAAQIITSSKFLVEVPLCVIFPKKHNKKSVHFLKIFNRGIQRLKSSGQYDRTIQEARG